MKQARITMRAARRQFAGRGMTAPATYKTHHTAFGTEKVIDQPRERTRMPLGASFRSWARTHFAKADASQLSPKLARIVGAR